MRDILSSQDLPQRLQSLTSSLPPRAIAYSLIVVKKSCRSEPPQMHFASLAQAIQNDQTGKGCRYLCPMFCEANSRSSLARLSRYDFKLILSLQSSLAKLSRTGPPNSQYRKAIAFNGKIILLLCCRGITLGRAATQAFGSPSPGHSNRCCMPVPSISKRAQVLSSQTRTRRIQSLTLHSHCSDSQPRYPATNSTVSQAHYLQEEDHPLLCCTGGPVGLSHHKRCSLSSPKQFKLVIPGKAMLDLCRIYFETKSISSLAKLSRKEYKVSQYHRHPP
jgi:hypothetical protein